MGTADNDRIARNTIFLYIRSIFLLLINLLTSRLVLQALGVDDFGIYSVVGGVVAMFSILGGSLSSASQRFVTFSLGKNDFETIKSTFSTCISLHIVLGVLIVFLLEVLGIWFLGHKLIIPHERIETAYLVMHLSIATFFINTVSVPYNAVIVAHERMNAFAYIGLFEGLLKLGGVLLLNCFLIDKLFWYGLLLFSIAIIMRLIYLFYCRRNFAESRHVKIYVKKDQFKEMFSFAGWNLIGQGSMVLRNQGIDVLLNMFFGVVVNAAKGISNQVQGVVHGFVGNFTSSINPQLVKAIAKEDYGRSNSLIYHGSRLSFFLMMVLVIPLSICTSEVLNIWLVNVPQYAVEMAKLSLFYIQSNTLSRLLINSILAHGNIRNFQLVAGGTKLLALPLAYIVLEMGGGPLTGIWLNIILDMVCRCEELFFVHRRSSYNVKRHFVQADLFCWFVFLCAYIASVMFYAYVSSNLILSALFSLLVACSSIWFVGVDRKEKEIILLQIKTLLAK